MQKNLYYASPLRRDYITKPVRNFSQNALEQTSRSGTARDHNQQIQKTTRFNDGLLVNFLLVNSLQSGLFIFNSSICLLYCLHQGKPRGKQYLIAPSGLMLSANYQLGILNKWLVATYSDKFVICYNYRRGIKEGQQYFYNCQEKLLVVSLYRKGKFQQIRNVEKGQLDKIIKNKQILQRIQQLKSKKLSMDKKFPHLKFQQYEYYGDLNDRHDVPHGYGILLGTKQIYIGNFNNGFLNGLGCIKFDDGNIYFGDFHFGTCSGYGSITNGKIMVYKYQQQNISKKQFDQYLEHVMVLDKESKWAEKYEELYQIFQEFNQKHVKDLKSGKSQVQSQMKSSNNISIKENHIDEHEHLSTPKQLDEKKDNALTLLQKSQNKGTLILKSENKGTIIPKLSIFQDEKSQGMVTIRQSEQQKTNGKKQTYIEKHSEPQKKNKQKYLKVPRVPLSAYREKYNPGMSENQQHLGTQVIKIDKWYVDWEQTHLKPNEMEIKEKFHKNGKQELQKKQGDTKINLGKIMRTGSEISEHKQDVLIEKLCF